MQVGKQMKTEKVINLLKVIIIGVLVVFAARMPFLHKNYEYVNSIYSTKFKHHDSKYKPIITKRNTTLDLLLSKLENGTITKENYIQKVKDIKNESTLALSIYNKKRNALIQSYKYRGFNAYYLFLLNIGTPIMAFVLCLLFFYVLINPVTTKIKKLVFSIYGSLFLFTASYFVLHALYAEQVYNGDFPKEWYTHIIKYVPVLVSLTIPLLFYHYQTIEQNLKTIINKLIVFIAKSEDYIESKEKKKEHFEKSFNLYEEILK